MSNLNISVIFAESSHCVSSSHVVSSFTHRCTHLDLQAVGDSCRPRETESRRRVLSTADKTESSLCVSVFSVFSQVTNPLSDSLVCWGYPKKYVCSCISEWPVFHSECHYKRSSFHAMKNVWQFSCYSFIFYLCEYKCTVCLGDILSTFQQVIHNSVTTGCDRWDLILLLLPCNLIDFNFVSEVSLNRINKDHDI